MPTGAPRCNRCGWPIVATIAEGCTIDNCSMRPMPPIRVAPPDPPAAECEAERLARELDAAAVALKFNPVWYPVVVRAAGMIRKQAYESQEIDLARTTAARDMREAAARECEYWHDQTGDHRLRQMAGIIRDIDLPGGDGGKVP